MLVCTGTSLLTSPNPAHGSLRPYSPSLTFVALVHATDFAPKAREIAELYQPSDIRTYELRRGQLTLCTWDRACPVANEPETVLLSVDKTRAAVDVPLGSDGLDREGVPRCFLRSVKQYRSYVGIDEHKRVAIWTDHVGLSKIFHASTGGCQVFSDDLSAFALFNPALDLSMVASFFANGSMLSGRTIYSGVRGIGPARLVVVSPEAVWEKRYWRFEPGKDIAKDVGGSGPELWHHVREAVLCHVGEHEIMLPLSGGYDSTCLLGLLLHAGRTVNSFSFVSGNPQPSSDAAIAARQAAASNVRHATYRIDDIDVVDMVKANILGGLLTRHPCYEISAYSRAAESALNSLKDPVFCLGDECFGTKSHRLADHNDLLGSIHLRAPSGLTALSGVIGPDAVSNLIDLLDTLYCELIEQVPPSDDRNDAKDWLYFNVRVAENLAPLRAHTVGNSLPFVCPLLDIRVLDVVQRLPSQQRIDKRFFKAVARKQLPEMFRIPRSRLDQMEPELWQLMDNQAARIQEALSDLKAGIPGVMSVSDLSAMFETVRTLRTSPGSVSSAMGSVRTLRRDAARFAISRGLVPSRLEVWLRGRLLNRFSWAPPPEVLFLRSLHLAMSVDALRAVQPRNQPGVMLEAP